MVIEAQAQAQAHSRHYNADADVECPAITKARNGLMLWATGKLTMELHQVQAMILELDRELQQHGY